MMPRSTWSSLLVACALLFSGCGSRGTETPIPPTPAASDGRQVVYTGQARLAGESFPVRLELDGPDSELDARMTIPALDLQAHGTGTRENERLELILFYGDACVGQTRVTVRTSDGGARLDGELVATDCTGEARGTVTLTRAPQRS